MKIRHLDFSFVLYLALIEGIALFVLDKTVALGGVWVGFVPAFIILLIYKITYKYIPIKINGKEVMYVPVIFLSIANGLFIVLLFFIQNYIPNFANVLSEGLYGLISVFLSFMILIFLYNIQPLKITIMIGTTAQKIEKMSYKFSVYAGIFEFFILPLMFIFYTIHINSFLNGLLSGLIGGIIALFVVNLILSKKPVFMTTERSSRSNSKLT